MTLGVNDENEMRLTIAIIAGIIVGAFMAWPTIGQGPICDLVMQNNFIGGIYRIINLPAEGMMNTWDRLHLPPHSDRILFLIPVMIFFQWAVTGALVGIIWTLKRK